MLQTILGNKTAVKVMLYLFHHGEGYGGGISKDMGITLSQVQKQLDRFNQAGILVCKKFGTVIVYSFNPKMAAVRKFQDLIGHFYRSIPLEVREEMFSVRRRPRRKGKPVIRGSK